MKSKNTYHLGSYKIPGGLKSSSKKVLDGPYYGLSSELTPKEFRHYFPDGKWIDSRDPLLFYLEKAQQLLSMTR